MSAEPSLRTAYLEHVRSRNASSGHLKAIDYALAQLRRFLGHPQEEEFERMLRAVTGEQLVRFAADLAETPCRRGRPRSPSTRAQIVQNCAQFYRFLARTGRMLVDITSALVRARRPRRLPRPIPTQAEMCAILETPDVKSPMGLRDRAILELFYSTGLRRGELTRLQVDDVELVSRVVRVRQGKGHKDRLVPVGQVAARWVGEYVRRIRPAFVRDGREPALFLNQYGEGLGYGSFADVVKRYTRRALIEKNVSCHSLRHAFATHLLQEGAGVRPIQAMLGHASLESTQIYTHLVPQDVARAIERFHPLETGGPPASRSASPKEDSAPRAGPLPKRAPPRRGTKRRTEEPPPPSAAPAAPGSPEDASDRGQEGGETIAGKM